MASTTPNIGLTLPTGAEKVSRQIINDNNTKIDTAIGTLNSNINPYGTKYIRGKFDVSSGSPATVLGKIQAFISGVTTDNKEVDFDVMLSYQGVHYFIGHLYPGKDWGHGFYIAVDGTAYKWTRLNNVDSVEEIALNGNIIPFKLSTKINISSCTLTVPNSSRHLIQVFFGNINAYWMGFIQGTGAGLIRVAEINKGSSITVNAQTTGNTVTFSVSSSTTIEVYDMCYNGDFMAIS